MTTTDDANKTVKLCEIDDVTDGVISRIDIDGRPVAYARVGDDWFAIDDTCSHAKVSLSDGIIDEDDLAIECPKHGALFSLETGAALTLPAIKPVASHAVHVEGSEVFVTLSHDDDQQNEAGS
ncbi:MAG: non-heme iron oxygenase ferredoxin subunit [Acidimicrobiia bacterium]|nr:non-heme iron oxygenase ferredoxin subunit [Acidimicrobiia bacterium]